MSAVCEVEDREASVAWFPCITCDGHGARVVRTQYRNTAELCPDCGGEGQRGATEEQVEAAACIGSDNPFCPHDWQEGDADRGDEGPIRCSICGADGDA